MVQVTSLDRPLLILADRSHRLFIWTKNISFRGTIASRFGLSSLNLDVFVIFWFWFQHHLVLQRHLK
ncbi:hypothetical protein R1flu_025898 [Riccia fluitans]|uniref:Uncharacterized protein n=1 Tax=Riccia fluitans TaxID=41844 RepID=A0ABD1Y218_9MARC